MVTPHTISQHILHETTTISTSNSTEIDPIDEAYVRPFSDKEIVVLAVILITLSVLGIFGNVLTILVIYTSKGLKTVFEIMIVSLCVSDLFSAIISPLALYRRTWGFDHWAIPSFLCKFYWASDLWTSYVTAFHIFSFCLLRFVSIKWPHTFSLLKTKHILLYIMMMWVTTLASGFVPFAIFMDSGIRNRSSHQTNAKWPACTCTLEWITPCKWYTAIGHPVFFYLPALLTLILSFLIAVILWKRTVARRRQKPPPTAKEAKNGSKEKQAILQLFLVVGSFFVGYIPFTAYASYTQNTRNTGNYGLRVDWVFGLSYYLCMRISECLNPVFYNIGSTKLRNATLKFLGRCCSCCIGGREPPSDDPTSSHTCSNTSRGVAKAQQDNLAPPQDVANDDEPVIHDEIPL